MSAQGEYKPSLNIPFLPGKMLSTLRLIEELKQKSRLLNRALYGPCQLTLSRPGFKKNISHFSTKSALLAIQIALYFFFIFVILLAHLKKRLAFLLVLKFYQIYILLLCWFWLHTFQYLAVLEENNFSDAKNTCAWSVGVNFSILLNFLRSSLLTSLWIKLSTLYLHWIAMFAHDYINRYSRNASFAYLSV